MNKWFNAEAPSESNTTRWNIWKDLALDVVKERYVRDLTSGASRPPVSSEEAELRWADAKPHFAQILAAHKETELNRRVDPHPLLTDRVLSKDDFIRLRQRADSIQDETAKKRYIRNLIQLARKRGVSLESQPAELIVNNLLE